MVGIALSFGLKFKKEKKLKDEPPQILRVWTDPPEGKVGETISLCFNAKDDHQLKEIKFYAEPLGETQISISQSNFFLCLPAIFEKEGEFSFEVQAKDDSEQWSEKVSQLILIKK